MLSSLGRWLGTPTFSAISSSCCFFSATYVSTSRRFLSAVSRRSCTPAAAAKPAGQCSSSIHPLRLCGCVELHASLHLMGPARSLWARLTSCCAAFSPTPKPACLPPHLALFLQLALRSPAALHVGPQHAQHGQHQWRRVRRRLQRDAHRGCDALAVPRLAPPATHRLREKWCPGQKGLRWRPDRCCCC